VASLAKAACVGARQLERRFLEEVGVSPKTLSRLTRFEHALRLRELHPEARWSRIALDAGFYDQMHLVKEFHALAGESPSGFASALGWLAPLGME
jgi:transcriptional regulator GlxA family with amidase domain